IMTVTEEILFVLNRDMCCSTTGVLSEKCVVRRFCRANITYLYTPRWYSLDHRQAVWLVQAKA
uniref:Uncharacterized protein n=1 Tax=Scleropages formosus TaxID=113540 RepID=A0A8C9SKY0_SCLFO